MAPLKVKLLAGNLNGPVFHDLKDAGEGGRERERESQTNIFHDEIISWSADEIDQFTQLLVAYVTIHALCACFACSECCTAAGCWPVTQPSLPHESCAVAPCIAMEVEHVAPRSLNPECHSCVCCLPPCVSLAS